MTMTASSPPNEGAQTESVPQDIANTVMDPGAHGDRKPLDDAYTWLRKNAPMAKIQPEGFDPFWAVVKYDDIQLVEKRSDVFFNATGYSTIGIPSDGIKLIKALTGGRPHVAHTLLEMDDEHRAHRLVTQKEFMPINLKKIKHEIDELAAEFAQKFIDRGGQCDFAHDIAFLYPLRVLMKIIGIPDEDEHIMLSMTQELFGTTDSDMNSELDEGAALDPVAATQAWIDAHQNFFDYFEKIVQDRRKNPQDDLATVLSLAKIDGEYMDPLKLHSYFMVLGAAGHDSTANSTSTGMWQLAENPDLLKKIKQNPDLIEGFVSESIRWETPVRHFMRNAREDFEIRGQTIKKGDWLKLCYPSGNRDEDIFEDPFAFNIERPNHRKHIGFGFGAHQCLGKYLAEMEMKSFWEAILPTFDAVELDGEPTRVNANFVSGPKTIPIKYTLAS